MDKLHIYELLKTINYPGFAKNIVDFGMVRSVEELGNDAFRINLHIVTEDQEKLKTLRNAVDALMKEEGVKLQALNIDTKRHIEAKKMEINRDPAEDKRQFEYADQVIAVASGKGGVGKSTVAANIALSLSAKGYKVGLLDLDVYGPSVPEIFKVEAPPIVEDEHSIHPAKKYGLELMSFGFFIGEKSPVIWRGPMVMKLVDQFLSDVKWSKLDYLILDLPPGTGDVQLTLSQKIFMTGAVIVTTPQDLALIDVSRGANMFEKMNVPVLGVIENMSYHLCTNCGHKDSIFGSGGGEKESKRLNVSFLGRLPLSADIMGHIDKGIPTVLAAPDSEEAAAFNNIVETLLEKLT